MGELKGSFLEAKGILTQIYNLDPKGALRILGIDYKSASGPPTFFLSHLDCQHILRDHYSF